MLQKADQGLNTVAQPVTDGVINPMISCPVILYTVQYYGIKVRISFDSVPT